MQSIINMRVAHRGDKRVGLHPEGIGHQTPSLLGMLPIPAVKCHEFKPRAALFMRFSCDKTLSVGSWPALGRGQAQSTL